MASSTQRHLCVLFAEWGLKFSYGFSSCLPDSKGSAVVTVTVHLVCNTGCRKTEVRFAVFYVLFRNRRQNYYFFNMSSFSVRAILRAEDISLEEDCVSPQ